MDIQNALLTLHLFGFAIGVGGATVTDVFFIKFLKDFRISKHEAEFMRTLSRILWAGVLILSISGLGLFLLDPARLLASSKFIAKMVVVLVLLINGIFLHYYVTPTLQKIAFHENHPQALKLRQIRQRAFISGGISITSWYYAFLLAMSRFKNISILEYVTIYGCLLVAAFSGALLMDYRLTQAAKRVKSKGLARS